MTVLVYGLILFCLSFLLHVVLWKIKLPKRQTKGLLQIFFGTLIGGLFVLWINSQYFYFFVMYVPNTFIEYLHISVLFISLAFVYVVTYPAIEADSPSLVMIMTIANAGVNGLDKKEFERILNDDLLVKPRLKDIIADKMAYLESGKYKLTPKGILLTYIFVIYRKILNAPKGG